MITVQDLLAEIRMLQERDLEYWIAEQWVTPIKEVEGPMFRDADVARVRLIAEIKYDFEVSDAALPVFLSLLDQSHDLRRRLDLLAEAIDAQPEDVRTAIHNALKETLSR
jgi:chaperone modulatory protein CbpM